MPGKKSPGPSIKRNHQYEALVNEHGMSKEKAAKFSNAQAKKLNGGKTPSKKTATKQLAAKKRRDKKK